jgi:hypothetical protein
MMLLDAARLRRDNQLRELVDGYASTPEQIGGSRSPTTSAVGNGLP